MINLNGWPRHLLFTAAARGDGTIVASPEHLDELADLGLVKRVPTYPNRGAITALGRQAVAELDKRRTVEDHLRDIMQKVMDGLPSGERGNVRNAVEYTHEDNGDCTITALYTTWNSDGTSTRYHLTITLSGSEVTYNVDQREDHHPEVWAEGGSMDRDDEADRRVIVDANVYYIRPETGLSDSCKGYGGRRWDIAFHDGRRVTTYNLWHAGIVAPKWRHRYPDNAVFDRTHEQEAQRRWEAAVRDISSK